MIRRTYPETSNLSSVSNDFPVNSGTPLGNVSYPPRLNFLYRFLRATPSSRTAAVAAFTGNKYYAVLFAAIYILSNKLVDLHSTDDMHKLFYELDHIFANIPGEYIKKLLHERLSSVKAVFESLIQLSASCEQPNAFSFLVDFGARLGWLAEAAEGHTLLYYAVSLGLPKALHILLDNKCRLDLKAAWVPMAADSETVWWSDTVWSNETTIVAALRQRNLDLAQQLIRVCDVNRPMQGLGRTNFDYFLANSHDYDEIFEKGLALFLERGLNVDRTVISPYTWVTSFGISSRIMKSELDLRILDYLFYFHQPLFERALLKSKSLYDGHLSKTGVMLSLKGGGRGLRGYLDGLTQHIDQKDLARLLHVMIIEQFLTTDVRGRKKATDLSVVRDLVSFGASIDQVLWLVPDILKSFTTLVGVDYNRCEMEAAQYLIENGATVSAITLSWLARLPDTRLLDLARDRVDGQKDWVTALVHTAARNDLKAVERVLPSVVDIHMDLNWGNAARRRPGTLSVIASVIRLWEADFKGLPEMLKIFVQHGAPLRLSARKPHLYHLLLFTLRHRRYPEPNTSAAMEYIIDVGYDTGDPFFQPERLLAACLRYGDLETFDYLFSKGARPPVNFPVAQLIGIGGEIEIVREMLDAGADVDAYIKSCDNYYTALQIAAVEWRVDIIKLLLEKGADVNAPAKGPRGVTALQASCANRPETIEGKEQQRKTISLLLESGADVNAPPARINGMTALQRAAGNGDFAVQQMLFPTAYVNAPPCQLKYDDHRKLVPPVTGTALDRAAENGRIDMVHFLLKCNAVSHHRGDTGYDGAIQLAERQGHFAVAELIRQYVVDNERGGISNQFLAEPPLDWCDYGCEQSSDDDPASGYLESDTD